jgi:sorbitol-specific phosphotransferase system component IIC
MRLLADVVQERVEQLSATCRAVLSRFDALPITAVFLYGSALTSGFRGNFERFIGLVAR